MISDIEGRFASINGLVHIQVNENSSKVSLGYSCPNFSYKVFICGLLAWTFRIVDHNIIMTSVLVIDKTIIMKAIHSRYCFVQSLCLLGIPI